jgi:importin subunit alpha-6/7
MSLRPESRADRRKKGFKKGIDADDARRKREDNIIELRKSKRDENLQKKRAVFAAGPASNAMEDSTRTGAGMQQKVGTLLNILGHCTKCGCPASVARF